MSYGIVYNVWCDAPDCCMWEGTGVERAEAAAEARRKGWSVHGNLAFCPTHHVEAAQCVLTLGNESFFPIAVDENSVSFNRKGMSPIYITRSRKKHIVRIHSSVFGETEKAVIKAAAERIWALVYDE